MVEKTLQPYLRHQHRILSGLVIILGVTDAVRIKIYWVCWDFLKIGWGGNIWINRNNTDMRKDLNCVNFVHEI
jgi:hypothetical protein